MFVITWLFTGIALWGTWLNSNAKRECFYFWIASNVAFFVINFLIGQFALSFLFFVYTLLAFKGLHTWKK